MCVGSLVSGIYDYRTMNIMLSNLISQMPAFTKPLFHWLDTRAAGVLLHPTSLPSPHGVGVFDESAGQFIEFLAQAGIKYWQLCPLGPTGYGDSPYQCFSSFAGNPYLIDPVALVRAGLLRADSLHALRGLDRKSVV